MMSTIEALWQRALKALGARGLLPASKSLTPGELAADVANRGEDRLSRLVKGWYYPASYGQIRGMLTNEEAAGIVAALEAEVEIVKKEPAKTIAPREGTSKRRAPRCDLCGSPLTRQR